MNRILSLIKDKTIRNWRIVAITVIALSLLAMGFSYANARDQDVIDEAKVVSLELAETIEASGSLEAQPFARLDWKTGGVVEGVYVQSGDKVKAGDVLLTLRPESTSANIASAQADLVTAQKNLEDVINSDSDLAQAVIDLKEAQEKYDEKSGYLKYLQGSTRVPITDTFGWYEKDGKGGWYYVYKTRTYRGPATEDMLIEAENNTELARADLEDLLCKVDRLKNRDQDILAAQARVDAAQATVNSLSIVAPFGGQVLSVEDRVGDVIALGDLSVNLANLDHLYIEMQVDESDIASLDLGDRAEVTLDAVPGSAFPGQVTEINPVGEVVSGLVKYRVRVELDDQGEDTFLPLGASANVVIQVSDASEALAVPITAIKNDGNGEYVLLIQGNDTAKRIDVVSGSIVGDLVVVTGELEAGDHVQVLMDDGQFVPPIFKKED